MEAVNFDDYSRDYIDIMNQQHQKYGDISYYSKQKAVIARELTNKSTTKILEFGCGIGRNLQFLQEEFPDAAIYASDISQESLDIAQHSNPNIKFLKDEELHTYNDFFDLIFIAGVYHHIPPKTRLEVTKNIFKLLKERGRVLCFEHNPYNPLTRHMVNTCEFDRDAVLLTQKELHKLFKESGFEEFENGYILFVPPKLQILNFIEKPLRFLPLGGQYYVSALKKEQKN